MPIEGMAGRDSPRSTVLEINLTEYGLFQRVTNDGLCHG